MAEDDSPRIAAVETATVSARAKASLKVRGARTVHDASTFVLVRVVTDAGVEGFGEVSATAAWSGEDAVTATHFIRDVFAPLLVGRTLAPIEAISTELDRVVRGNWFTKAGINTALWDALGHTVGQPVVALLGGPFRTEVPVKISLSGDGDDLRAGYETAYGLGFRSFKVKVGRELATDVARVRLARELAGDDALIGADANGGWTLSTALEAVRELESADLHFIEQPVRADDLEGLREVRALGTPVVADESVYSPSDVLRVGRAEAADIVSIYVGKSSALERAVDSARLAGGLGMDVVIGANGEMGIGAAAQLHVACACERISEIPHGIIGHHFYDDEHSLETPLDIDGVRATLPTGPGLGVVPSAEVRRAFSS